MDYHYQPLKINKTHNSSHKFRNSKENLLIDEKAYQNRLSHKAKPLKISLKRLNIQMIW